ncbi:glycerol-3-phosphate 1-O-acyltransferase PlsY [Bacillus sp. T33-2]|uniref:glycerol-3-phosphate 1-O-acyltransferase PlsY n=1 Tax=Bacillus sp. T33-2 TaxID=2054168 RepID=UPI000C7716B4|nr:glycerol-3-phosphate 1-O-acyltransferase PlsY [Bacillus sp. T33-2]PLR99227.1 acyl-phosphate glycerol 3-phosphate acyltransferase [Bacillus sp. T33-2]
MDWFILAAAYLLGSIPTALLVGRLFFKIDIRDHGSKNPGATNTLRVLGKKAAIIVLLIDVGKAMLAAALPLLIGSDLNPLYSGLAAVVGHCFPVFAGFRGGKAIAATAGALIISDIPMFITAYLTFFAIIFITKYVFLGSISVGAALFVYSFFIPGHTEEIVFALFMLFLIYLHRSNLQNFFDGTEPKINDKNIKKDRIYKTK